MISRHGQDIFNIFKINTMCHRTTILFLVALAIFSTACLNENNIKYLVTCSVCLSVTTSVGAALNWREWRFIQSYMGWLTLALALSHLLVQGLAHSWVGGAPFTKVVQKLSFLSMLLPSFVILLKLILCIPCVDYCLTRICHGYDRDADCNTYKLDMERENDTYSSIEMVVRQGKSGGRTAGHINATFDVIDVHRNSK